MKDYNYLMNLFSKKTNKKRVKEDLYSLATPANDLYSPSTIKKKYLNTSSLYADIKKEIKDEELE